MPSYVVPVYASGLVGNIVGSYEWDIVAGDIEYLKSVTPATGYSTTVVTPPSTAEVDVWSITVPANTLGTNKGIWGKFFYRYDDDTANTFTIKMYYGTTVITATTPANFAGFALTGIVATCDFMIMGSGAANAQQMGLNSFFTNSLSGLTTTSIYAYSATVAEDSTIDKTLKFSFTQGAVGTAVSFKSGYYLIGA